MIDSIAKLKEWLNYEKKLYPNSLYDYLVNDQRVLNWKYLKYLRISEYFYNKKKFIFYLFYLIFTRKKNKLGAKIGVEIQVNCCDKGLLIHHNGSIVINGKSKIGKNCQLHGQNCIGNKGKGTECPIIGDNLDLGVGASILGGVVLGNNIKVGAGAVVVHSCHYNNITLIGIPAKIKDVINNDN